MTRVIRVAPLESSHKRMVTSTLGARGQRGVDYFIDPFTVHHEARRGVAGAGDDEAALAKRQSSGSRFSRRLRAEP